MARASNYVYALKDGDAFLAGSGYCGRANKLGGMSRIARPGDELDDSLVDLLGLEVADGDIVDSTDYEADLVAAFEAGAEVSLPASFEESDVAGVSTRTLKSKAEAAKLAAHLKENPR